eukprot:350661-Chlamydomonas_euryale.AAC.3
MLQREELSAVMLQVAQVAMTHLGCRSSRGSTCGSSAPGTPIQVASAATPPQSGAAAPAGTATVPALLTVDDLLERAQEAVRTRSLAQVREATAPPAPAAAHARQHDQAAQDGSPALLAAQPTQAVAAAKAGPAAGLAAGGAVDRLLELAQQRYQALRSLSDAPHMTTPALAVTTAASGEPAALQHVRPAGATMAAAPPATLRLLLQQVRAMRQAAERDLQGGVREGGSMGSEAPSPSSVLQHVAEALAVHQQESCDAGGPVDKLAPEEAAKQARPALTLQLPIAGTVQAESAAVDVPEGAAKEAPLADVVPAVAEAVLPAVEEEAIAAEEAVAVEATAAADGLLAAGKVLTVAQEWSVAVREAAAAEEAVADELVAAREVAAAEEAVADELVAAREVAAAEEAAAEELVAVEEAAAAEAPGAEGELAVDVQGAPAAEDVQAAEEVAAEPSAAAAKVPAVDTPLHEGMAAGEQAPAAAAQDMLAVEEVAAEEVVVEAAGAEEKVVEAAVAEDAVAEGQAHAEAEAPAADEHPATSEEGTAAVRAAPVDADKGVSAPTQVAHGKKAVDDARGGLDAEVDAAPAAEEAPATDEVPAAEEAPAAEDPAAAEETTASEEVPASEEASAAEEAPAAEETTASEEVPASEEASAAEEAPAAEETTASEEVPASEEASAAEEAPAAEHVLTAEEAAAAEEAAGAAAAAAAGSPAAEEMSTALIVSKDSELAAAQQTAGAEEESVDVGGESELVLALAPSFACNDASFAGFGDVAAEAFDEATAAAETVDEAERTGGDGAATLMEILQGQSTASIEKAIEQLQKVADLPGMNDAIVQAALASLENARRCSLERAAKVTGKPEMEAARFEHAGELAQDHAGELAEDHAGEPAGKQVEEESTEEGYTEFGSDQGDEAGAQAALVDAKVAAEAVYEQAALNADYQIAAEATYEPAALGVDDQIAVEEAHELVPPKMLNSYIQMDDDVDDDEVAFLMTAATVRASLDLIPAFGGPLQEEELQAALSAHTCSLLSSAPARSAATTKTERPKQ